MAKCSKKITPNGKELTKVRGTTIKFGTSGIVDKLIVTKKQSGGRMAKVRIRKIKIPGIGDKLHHVVVKKVCVEWLYLAGKCLRQKMVLSLILLLILMRFQVA